MRKIGLLFISVMVFTVTSFSQSDEVVEEDYDRSAVTVKMLDYKHGKYRGKLRSVFVHMPTPDKFDNNNLSDKIVETPLREGANNQSKVTAIIEQLEKEKAGNEIIAKWFNRQPDGTMNMELIHERGLYNAVDADVKKAKASKRGKAMLMDMGLKLLGKTYIVVIDYAKIRNAKELKIEDQHGWRTPLNVYLFRVKYNNEVQARLFDEMWVYEDDDPSTAKTKKEKFDNFTFEIEHVMTQSNPVDLSRLQYDSDTQIGQFLPQKSDDELFKELVAKGVQRSFFLLEKHHEDFRVKTPLYDKQPLRAKIGKKEGLKVDQRYFVYEYEYNEKTKESEPNRKGVIRARRVVDNREVSSGETPTSKFYQISGGGLEKGMTMQQRSDWGISLQGRALFGEIGGGAARLSLNTARYIGIPQLKIYGFVGYDIGTYTNDVYWPNMNKETFSFIRYGAGLSKGFYFARMFSLEPSVSATWESANADKITFADFGYKDGDLPKDTKLEDDLALNIVMTTVGADLGFQPVYWLKVFGGIQYHVILGDPYVIDDDEATDLYFWDENDKKSVVGDYTDLFEGRQGLSFTAGLQIEF